MKRRSLFSTLATKFQPLFGPLRRFVGRVPQLRHLAPLKIVFDALLIVAAASWAWFICYSQTKTHPSPLPFIAVALVMRSLIGYMLSLQRTSWIHVSRHEVVALAISTVLGTFAIGLTFKLLPDPFTLVGLVRPQYIFLTEPAFYLLLLSGARITARAFHTPSALPTRGNARRPRILIVGAQAAGRALAFHIEETTRDYEVVGFVDDDAGFSKRSIRGVRVLGTLAETANLARAYEVDEIVIALSPLPPERLRELLIAFGPADVPVRILPPLKDLLVGGRDAGLQVRDVQMEDLLPRPEVKIDPPKIDEYLRGRTVLVTGGGGSIGGELCRQVLSHGARRLVVLGRGENSVFEIVQELNELNEARGADPCEIVPVICDVRDRAALHNIFEEHRPGVVFHAAAHKHVPLMEQFPGEAIKNNVLGTLNVVELSVEYEIGRFVMVSTDKAVDPSSVMGATKRLGEMIVRGYAQSNALNMVSVRFGNVLGSRGSVVPTMQRQIRAGRSITITDPEMVRYFMTIPEASSLILQAGAVGGRGEVFILDMGQPVRIVDLAHDLIRLSGLVPGQDVEIRIIGRRPGEKMREEILSDREADGANKNGAFYTAPPVSVELVHLLGKIERLRQAAVVADDERTVAMLQTLVPEFTPDARWHVASKPMQNGQPQHDDARSPQNAAP